MQLSVFLAVLTAAGLHATWNALVKHATDKTLSMYAVVLGHAPFAAAAMMFAPAPAPDSWGYMAVGVFLHVGYQLFLASAYRHGDLTQVYPIARGSAPLIIAVVSLLFLGVSFSHIELFAIALIAVGVMSLVLASRADGLINLKAGVLALATGGFIAAYSLVDGLGARTAGTALGYYAWHAIFNTLLLSVIMSLRYPGIVRRAFIEARKTAIIGGGASFCAYALVMWGFTQAPIALVAALRELSIIFALVIGVVFLKESVNLAKVASTAATISGAVLVKLSR